MSAMVTLFPSAAGWKAAPGSRVQWPSKAQHTMAFALPGGGGGLQIWAIDLGGRKGPTPERALTWKTRAVGEATKKSNTWPEFCLTDLGLKRNEE